jgi:uncharacterized protein YfaS (alpha-2-macroglobulin family)
MRSRPRAGLVAISLLLASALMAGACTGGGSGDAGPPADPDAKLGSGPFLVALSTGHPATAAEVALAVVDGERLSDDDIAAVVRRLPRFVDDAEPVPFRRPVDSLPRPRVGATIDRPFGIAPRPPVQADPDGPLRVLRYQPQGDVSIAPDLSVTFNQPMVALGTLAHLDQADVAVKVTPALDGRWRWIGTRTLRFEFEGALDRLPMATNYTVEVPAGTTSATGNALAETVRWTFRTPAPTVRSLTPQKTSVDLQPVFVATFDQRVDPAALLGVITLKAGDDERDLRIATTAEIQADERARGAVDETQDGRWVAFRPVEPLPRATRLSIAIGPEAPSAEGPRTTKKAATYTARTYPPLKVSKSTCGFAGCRPGSEFIITFTNPLDIDAFDSDTITIDPDVPSTISASGDSIVISAATKADTTYAVRIPETLRDEFGQMLGAAERVSFDVGRALPRLNGFDRRLITTDPMSDRPAVAVTSVGHETLKVDVYAVAVSDWTGYQAFLDRWDGQDLDDLPDWERISSSTIDVPGGGRDLAETTIDLADDLGAATGHLVVVVSPTREFAEGSPSLWENRPTVAWVQTTQIGVDALATDDELVAWATDLSDGAPLDGVEIRLAGDGDAAITDGDGLVRVGLGRARFLTATQGNDVALLPADTAYEWQRQTRPNSVVGFAFDDRGLYRPGETVRVKGWFRRVSTTDGTSVTPLEVASAAKWTASDAFGNELGKGTVELSAASGFDLEIDVPLGAALGPASLRIDPIDGGTGGITSLQFDIQEFRRPEFEVVTRAESAGPHLLTKPVTVAAVAQYFSGGTLPDAPATWQVTTRSTTYSPPNWSQFSFGEVQPWWIDDFGFGGFDDFGARGGFAGDFVIDRAIGPCCSPTDERAVTYEGRTDSTGTHYLQLDFQGEKPDLPITVAANAAVQDVNRQSFASNLEVLVHPADLYVGLRSARQFVRAGEQLDIEAIVTDIDGAPVAGRAFTVTVVRLESKFDNGEFSETEVNAQSCELASEDEPVSCSIDVDTGGEYKVRAVVVDDAGGTNRSEFTRWVSGAEAVAARRVELESATLVPDAEEYEPGDTAEMLVVAPFADGSGLLTISANGTTDTTTFELDEGSAVLSVPITERHVPGVAVTVDLAGHAPRLRDDGTTNPDLAPRPAFAAATLSLPVKPVAQTLAVSATARDATTEPGAANTIDVAVRDSDGVPVSGAEVAVVVVDEAVLSLTGYQLPDPVAAFYGPRYEQRYLDHLRSSLVLANPEIFSGAPTSSTTAAGAGGDDGLVRQAFPGAATADAATAEFSIHRQRALSGGVTGGQIEIRSNFDALALFAPTVRTGGSGTASVELNLPDNLTRYRVMAVAADGRDAFGAGESTLTARLPLQVRPSAPRLLNFGDRFDFPVVLQNQTDDAIVADVVIETSNLTLSAGAGRRVEIPANERVEVRFPVAADEAGTARYRVSAVGGDHADSAGGELPVYTPVTTEAFATYGVIDGGAVAQPLVPPAGVVPQFGGLEIDTSSTALQALTDAVVYLEEYDYRSADAYASRIIALTSLRDVFAAFGGERVPSADELDARIKSDVAALVALQREGGGFGVWTRYDEQQPYVSVQATEALVLARLAGFEVSEDAYRAALGYVASIETAFPSWWDTRSRHAVSAYALHVRARAGDRDPGKAEALYRSDGDLPLDALAWLWPVVDDPAIDGEIARTIDNRAHDSPATVTFSHGYDDGTHLVLASDRRTDGIVLDALISKRPGSDMIPKVVAGLIGNQVQGRWGNVQENGFILVALQRYFATFEAQTPDFVARAWLGDTYAAEHGYAGRTVERQHTLVPMSELIDPATGAHDIVVAKEGVGRLYYRLGLRYAPADFALDPRDEGFVVDRIYEAVDDPTDVRRDADGTWHMRAGALVRVRLTLVADSNHTNMALLDPLPAGLEALSPTLAASPRPPAENPEPGDDVLPEWYGWTWFDHENLRDDRAEVYSAYLVGGAYEYSYVARATTPGEFVVPPARAEEIYAPEVFGRSGSDRVVVGSGVSTPSTGV